MNANPRPVTTPWGYTVGGDPALRQTSQALARTIESASNLGVVVGSKTGQLMRRIREMSAKTTGVGGRILLGEGTYFVRSGATISVPGIELVGLGERTIFRRIVDDGQAMLTLAGAGIKLTGITFEDTTATRPVILATGTYCEVHRCTFTSCDSPVTLAGAWQQVSECLVKVSRNASWSIHLVAATDCSVQCNRIDGAPVGADEIYGDDTSARCSFVGNVTGNPGSVNYKGAGLGSVDAGNTGTVTIRP